MCARTTRERRTRAILDYLFSALYAHRACWRRVYRRCRSDIFHGATTAGSPVAALKATSRYGFRNRWPRTPRFISEPYRRGLFTERRLSTRLIEAGVIGNKKKQNEKKAVKKVCLIRRGGGNKRKVITIL